jgi:hypothetical protein
MKARHYIAFVLCFCSYPMFFPILKPNYDRVPYTWMIMLEGLMMALLAWTPVQAMAWAYRQPWAYQKKSQQLT